MAKRIMYLTYEEVVAINKEVLSSIKVKKADAFEVMSSLKIHHTLDDVKKAKGDVYDKAVVLLTGLIQSHPFASGNRRTAMLATIRFLRMNMFELKFKEGSKILQGIREDYYTNAEIKEWLQGGDIRDFKR